jgi:biopolymer transport protein ExbD
MEDRQTLLSDYDAEQRKERNISIRTLITVYLVMLLAFMIFLPKIYIKNEIYYTSREMSKLYGQYELLLEENRALKLKIESIRFKNQVLDVLAID